MQSFSEHLPSREGEEGPLVLQKENSSHLVPLPVSETRCTDRAARTRPQTPGCSYRAPPAGHGLRSPRSGHGFGSERPPGWDLRIPPVRLRLPLTSLGGEDPASPRAGARALLPDAPQVRAPHTERWRRRRELPSERFACPAVSAPGGR